MHLLQKHLQDTPTRFGVGSNRTKVALSILRHEAEQRSNGLASIIGWKAEIGVAILDDGMQVSVSLPFQFIIFFGVYLVKFDAGVGIRCALRRLQDIFITPFDAALGTGT